MVGPRGRGGAGLRRAGVRRAPRDSTALPYWLLARFASDSVKVALSGEGGDELFGGYQTYQADLLGRPAARAAALMSPAWRRGPASAGRLSLDFRLRRLARGAGLKPSTATTPGRRSSTPTSASSSSPPSAGARPTRWPSTALATPRPVAPTGWRGSRTSTSGPTSRTTCCCRPTARAWRTVSRSGSRSWIAKWRRWRWRSRGARRSPPARASGFCAPPPLRCCRARRPWPQAGVLRARRRMVAGPLLPLARDILAGETLARQGYFRPAAVTRSSAATSSGARTFRDRCGPYRVHAVARRTRERGAAARWREAA